MTSLSTPRLHSFGKSRYCGSCDDQVIEMDSDEDGGEDNTVVRFSCGDGHSALVTRSGKLHTFGSNEWGQLGNGTTSSSSTPSWVKVGKNAKVVDAFCGRNHTVAMTSDGKLYSFGAGADNALGHGDCQDVITPKLISGEIESQRIIKVACGAYHTLALSSDGDVWVFGSGSESQLGNYLDECPEPALLELEPPVKIVDIAAGYYHSALVSDAGKLYVFGEGEAGKLGQGNCEECEKPTRVKGIKGKVISVACGGNHTCVATDLGHVYTFGAGQFGQLGQDTKIQAQTSPALVKALSGEKIVKVRCGGEFTVFLNDRGEGFTCGDGHFGKLGHGPGDVNIMAPKKLSQLCNVMDACAGGNHLLVLSRDLDKASANALDNPPLALPGPSELPSINKGRLRPLKQDVNSVGIGSDDEVVRRLPVDREPLVLKKPGHDQEGDGLMTGRPTTARRDERAKRTNRNVEIESDNEESETEEETEEDEEEVFAENRIIHSKRKREHDNESRKKVPLPRKQQQQHEKHRDDSESETETDSEAESSSDEEVKPTNQAPVSAKKAAANAAKANDTKQRQKQKTKKPPVESDDDDDNDSDSSGSNSKKAPVKNAKTARKAKKENTDEDQDVNVKGGTKGVQRKPKAKKNQVEPEDDDNSSKDGADSDDSDAEIGCCGKKKKKKETKLKKVKDDKKGKEGKKDGKKRKASSSSSSSSSDDSGESPQPQQKKNAPASAKPKGKKDGKAKAKANDTAKTKAKETKSSSASSSESHDSDQSPKQKKKTNDGNAKANAVAKTKVKETNLKSKTRAKPAAATKKKEAGTKKQAKKEETSSSEEDDSDSD